MKDFIKESKHIRKQYYEMQSQTEKFHEIIRKLSLKIFEYEHLMSEIKKNLQFQNIRRVYRLLNLPMPKELEEHLVESGAILWEEFTKTAVNKYDVKGVLSQHLGSFETGLTVLPPVNSLYINVADDTGPGMFRHQLDLSPLYVAIES